MDTWMPLTVPGSHTWSVMQVTNAHLLSVHSTQLSDKYTHKEQQGVRCTSITLWCLLDTFCIFQEWLCEYTVNTACLQMKHELCLYFYLLISSINSEWTLFWWQTVQMYFSAVCSLILQHDVQFWPQWSWRHQWLVTVSYTHLTLPTNREV